MFFLMRMTDSFMVYSLEKVYIQMSLIQKDFII